MTRWTQAAVLTTAAVVLASPTALYAQVKVTDNEPIKARLASKKAKHQYTVPIKNDGDVLKLRVTSKTTKLYVTVLDPEGRYVPLYIGGKPASNFVEGGAEGDNIVCQTKALVAKTYTIEVHSARFEQDGPYVLTVTAPDLGAESGDESPKLRDEVKELRKRVERLEQTLERMMKLLEKK